MLFVNGSESVPLDRESVDVMRDSFNKNEFTIDEVAVYWAGFISIGRSDHRAMLFYETILNKLYDAYGVGKIVLCYSAKHDGFANNSSQLITISGVSYVFRFCEVGRESLKMFAGIVNEYPLFLFCDRKQGRMNDEDNKDDGKEKTITRLDERLKVILQILESFGYDDLFSIPYGGCAKVKKICLSDYAGKPTLFTDTTFPKAWQSGLKKRMFKMEKHDMYSSKK